MATRNRSFAALLLIAILALALASVGSLASAQSERDAFWREYNTEITINEDGSFHVVETQLVAFTGTFRFGTRIIPNERFEALENVEVAVANDADSAPETFSLARADRGQQGTYTVNEGLSGVEIVYYFDPTSGSEDRLIVIEYDVIGGLNSYPDETPPTQQLRWIAVSSEVVDSADVRSSTVIVHLPEAVAFEDTVYQPENAVHDADTFTWTRQNLTDQFDIAVQFPQMTDAAVPPWQAAEDERILEQAEQSDKNNVTGVVYLAAGLLIAVGGTLFVALRWFTTGRDPKIGLIADIVTEPPDDLHPGAAGTLVDERTDTRDVVATLVDLGRRGIIHIDEKTSGGFAGFGASTIYEIQIVDLAPEREDYENVLLEAIFPDGLEVGKSTPMHMANERMQRSAGRIHEGFYREVVEHGYFEKDPNKVRARYSMMGIFAPILAAIVWAIMSLIYGGTSGWLWFMIFSASFVFFIGVSVSKAMVRKTMAGAEAAAKWNAFKRYLDDIEDRANLEESRAIYERFLPYAVAFGIEKGWVTKFERAGVPTPDWFGGGPVIVGTGGDPMRTGRRGGGTWIYGGSGPFSPGGGGSSSQGGGGWNIPDLQGSSDSAARGLGGASGSLLGMIGAAAKVISSSSGGGGGFGGGGGGFSGGGGFGGGGGGGSSSFG